MDTTQLTPERLAQARLEWVTNPHVNSTFPTADAWALAKWAAPLAGAETSDTPASPAAVLPKPAAPTPTRPPTCSRL